MDFLTWGSGGSTPPPAVNSTITPAQVAVALRLQADDEDVPEPLHSELERLRDAAEALISAYGASDVPDAIHREAALRICNFLYSQDDSPKMGQDILRQSSADALLRPFREFGCDVV